MEEINEDPPSENYRIISITLIVIGWIAVFRVAGTYLTTPQGGYISSMLFLVAIPATIGLCGVLVAEYKHAQRVSIGFTIFAPFICHLANIILFAIIGSVIGEQYNGVIALAFQILLSMSFIYLVFYKKIFPPRY